MDFFKGQLTKIPKITPVNLSQCTVLITGANTGLGLEAAREILRSKPQRLILAVRNIEKGNMAKKDLNSSKAANTQIDVRKLDQASFRSVQEFARGLEGQRVDIAILNAGVWNSTFNKTSDGYESDLQVNTLAPALLSLLLLPNLRIAAASPRDTNTPKPHMALVSSGLHKMAKFSEHKLPSGEILAALNDVKKYNQQDRYAVTKTIGMFWTRDLARRISSSEIIINAPTPGFCKTGLMRNTSGIMGAVVGAFSAAVGRSVVDGARCLVDAVLVQREESHGKFLSEVKVTMESNLVCSKEGEALQVSLWDEIMGVFAKENIEVKI